MDVSRIRGWEVGFLEYMSTNHPEVGEAIRDESVMSDETEAALRNAIESYSDTFVHDGASRDDAAEAAA